MKGIKILITLQLILLAFLLQSCGKTNKVDSNKVPGSPDYGRTALPGVNPQSQAIIDQVKGQYPCQSGARLPDMIYTTPAGYSGNYNNIQGSFTPGAAGGTVGAVYIGVSSFKDVMVVTKMTNGAQVTGYNVALSMCPYQPLVIPGRALSNFQAPLGITLIDSVNCATGGASASLTRLDAAAYQMYSAAIVETTFSPAGCGN